jgi:phospholipid/cholesterol/gamma-HCH transport system permease protein
MRAMISGLGARFWAMPEAFGRRVNMLGRVLLSGYRLAVGRYGLSAAIASKRVLLAQVWFTAVQALVLVCGAGLLLAGIMMGVGYSTLAGWGAQRGFGDLMRLVVLTEFGPLLTALIVIGRSGTAVTTELAGMRLNREIDALEVHGVNSFAYLAVPRLFGVALANLSLTLFLVASAYAGCILLAPLLSLTSVTIFVRDLGAAIHPGDVTRCAAKGLLFGFAIPIVTLYHGFTLRQDINEIPRAGTRAVVGAMVFVFAIDAIIALVGHG